MNSNITYTFYKSLPEISNLLNRLSKNTLDIAIDSFPLHKEETPYYSKYFKIFSTINNFLDTFYKKYSDNVQLFGSLTNSLYMLINNITNIMTEINYNLSTYYLTEAQFIENEYVIEIDMDFNTSDIQNVTVKNNTVILDSSEKLNSTVVEDVNTNSPLLWNSTNKFNSSLECGTNEATDNNYGTYLLIQGVDNNGPNNNLNPYTEDFYSYIINEYLSTTQNVVTTNYQINTSGLFDSYDEMTANIDLFLQSNIANNISLTLPSFDTSNFALLLYNGDLLVASVSANNDMLTIEDNGILTTLTYHNVENLTFNKISLPDLIMQENNLPTHTVHAQIIGYTKGMSLYIEEIRIGDIS